VIKLKERCGRQLQRIDRFQQIGIRQPPLNVLDRLQPLLSLLPLDAVALAAGRTLLQTLNRPALEQLQLQLVEQGVSNGNKALPVIVGCRLHRRQAESCQNNFVRTGHWPQPLLVEGNPRLPDWCLQYCAKAHRLTLPVDDSYSGLPRKMIWLVLALGLLDQPPAILKMDDDAQPGSPQALQHCIDLLHKEHENQTVAAVGYPIRVASPLSLDRGWHLGKSSARANRKVFSSLGAKQWLSGGVGYLLSAVAVRQLAEYAMHSWGFVESMLYEDVCVSMLLEAANLQVHWLTDPDQLGLLNERTTEIAAGQWRNEEPPC
jgi:hypothetical protein